MKNLLIFFFACSLLSAQDLTGKWVLVNNMDNGYYAELNLVQNQKNKYAGHSYDTQNNGFCRHWLDANFILSSKKLMGRDVELIDKTPDHQATDYDLMYYVEDGEEFLMGTQTITPLKNNMFEISPLDMFFSGGSTSMVVYMKVSDKYNPHFPGMPNIMSKEEIELEKSAYPEINKHKDQIPTSPVPPIANEQNTEEDEDTEKFYEEDVEKSAEKSAEKPAEKAVESESIDDFVEENQDIVQKKENRTNKLLSHITVQDVKTVKLLIKDYGEEDNDSISIFFNNELIANNIRLKHEAQEFVVQLKPKEMNELVFVANNLGDVPPNTARITLIINERRYRYKLFTDESNNAMIKIENQ